MTTETKTKPLEVTAELRFWRIVGSRTGSDSYAVAKGEIFNDSRHRFRDGDLVTTSYITKIDLESGLIYTRNSVYSVGPLLTTDEKLKG